jgi:hypothetical protein
MSANIFRAETFKIFRKLFVNDSEYVSSYEYVKSIDMEAEKLVAEFPWYFQIDSKRECAKLPPGFDFITWQHHTLHSCICMQRIRMNRPFLHARIGDSWSVCAKAANDVLAVYQNLRGPDEERFRKSQKFFVQGYQIFSAAVALAAFLLVERSFPVATIRKDIEMVISDLSLGDEASTTMADGKKILAKMLAMYDARDAEDPLESESLVPEISSVMGGEQTTRKYLKRLDIAYVLNGSNGGVPDGQLIPVPISQGVMGQSVIDGVAGDCAEVMYAPELDVDLELLNQYGFLLPDVAYQP